MEEADVLHGLVQQSGETKLDAWAADHWFDVIWPYYRWVAVAQVPYLIWVSLATVLQLSITWMNWGR